MLEPTFYRTRDENANHYTTDAVSIHIKQQRARKINYMKLKSEDSV